MKLALCIVLSILAYESACVLNAAASGGIPMENGISYGVFFGSLIFVFTYPCWLAGGFVLRWLAELVLRRELPMRQYLPFWGHLPISMLLLATMPGPPTPEGLIREYVADECPASLGDFGVWMQRGFGHQTLIMSYSLDPAEFPLLLKRHEFKESHDAAGVDLHPLDFIIRRVPGIPIQLPDAPLVWRYSHFKDQTHLQQVNHYLTRDKARVITYISYN
ncbi:MAG TPA: hypothetical protein PK490_23525 [Prosthecobacter sp.]|nr:hypothetical protein [Prosthecobacter sp.]HRK17268.1 hypothetical protein [Prosthecobacter sp.]